ncbi:Retrovirus-related Pol polyprotein from transposon RE1 [Vitis vinifera]|uniref:Retrovirus-related Pol polyprotein from transposon RE1 n=1 Tax=Vitis vinifera TaxID=29760 RepID=A0A438H7A9_VITVI|nr:Retrovirus-related Pol polyprotein from transposon RE1 [Vitis vinifera]
MIETQYNAKVRVLRSDNGGEYHNSDLQKYLEGHGIIHQTTCSNTPQQNGVAERKNRHLLEGEYHKEIQTLDYDISKEDEYGQFELVNQEAGEPSSNDHPKAKEVIKEGRDSVLNLEPDPFMKRFPHRHNRAIPNSVQEALANPRWKAAMNEEMKSLQKNETWELVECPPGKKPVGCRWIYTVKYKADGSIERFKARLVAKWYTQTYGIDYTETFAPVAKINIVRLLLSLAANLDWPLQQFDVKNVFLHGELSEEQSPRAWFGRFTKSMRAFGYRQSISDHTLFLKKQHGKITTLIVYVDDMIVTGNDPEERKALQNYLSREFEMKDLGPLKYFLGIEVSRSSEGIFLSQRKYALDLLQETGMSGCQPVDTPIEEVDDKWSTSGYFTFVGGNLVTWKSKKQNVVARSSAEAEFRGMALGLCEVLWLRLLLQDLGYLSRQPIRLFCDNKAACDIAHNPIQHDRTKHVEVDRFFIKEKLDDKIVELPKIRSKDQLADILTKAVSRQVFSKFLDKLGMYDIYAPT